MAQTKLLLEETYFCLNFFDDDDRLKFVAFLNLESVKFVWQQYVCIKVWMLVSLKQFAMLHIWRIFINVTLLLYLFIYAGFIERLFR
jgi:hypothetical protein